LLPNDLACNGKATFVVAVTAGYRIPAIGGTTEIEILLLVADTGLAHDELLVINTATMSPLESEVVEKVGALLPELTPFTCH
jgi:hypothetical protein